MSLDLQGWGEFLGFLDGGAKKHLDDEVKAKMQRSVDAIRAASIAYIRSAGHGVPNAPLTALIKGSSLPLGELLAAITTAVEVTSEGVVGACGLQRTGARVGKGGGHAYGLVNVGIMLHEGFVIKVTPAVRAAVFAELRRRQGKSARIPSGSGSGAQTWRVRGRPFIRVPLEQATPTIVAELGEGVLIAFKK